MPHVFSFFFLVFASHSRIFQSCGDVTIVGKRLQIFNYARHSWPWSSEGSFSCHTYNNTGHPFIIVISEDPWPSHLIPSGYQWTVPTCLYDLGLSWLGFEQTNKQTNSPSLHLDVRYRMGMVRKGIGILYPTFTKRLIFRESVWFLREQCISTPRVREMNLIYATTSKRSCGTLAWFQTLKFVLNC